MSGTDAVLRVLQLQVQFELAQAMADAAAARGDVVLAEQAAQRARERCDVTRDHIRRIETRRRIDPALLEASHRMYRAESSELRRRQVQVEAAKTRESHTLDVLLELRGRERMFEKAMELQRLKRRQAQQLASASVMDELWLQRPRAEMS